MIHPRYRTNTPAPCVRGFVFIHIRVYVPAMRVYTDTRVYIQE